MFSEEEISSYLILAIFIIAGVVSCYCVVSAMEYIKHIYKHWCFCLHIFEKCTCCCRESDDIEVETIAPTKVINNHYAIRPTILDGLLPPLSLASILTDDTDVKQPLTPATNESSTPPKMRDENVSIQIEVPRRESNHKPHPEGPRLV